MRYSPLLLVCPFLQGCLAFGYPSITQTPPLVVKEADVKAFRVTSGFHSYGPWMTGPIELHGAIQEIPIHDHEVAVQRDAYFAYYYLAFPLMEGSYGRSFDIRLYRRGYETMVIQPRSWMFALAANRLDNIAWKKAETLEAQEKAIDDVIAGLSSWNNDTVKERLAIEYLTLADIAQVSGPQDEKTCKRLQEKAKMVRKGGRYFAF